MRDHFEIIDDERHRRGATPMHEELIELLARHEKENGTVSHVLKAQDAIKKALGKRGAKTLLDHEKLMTKRTIDAERIAYNLGFEHGRTRGRAEQVEGDRAKELSVAIGDLIVRLDAEEREVLRAMANALAGLADR